MRDYATLINIIYNPASYCEHSWLTLPYQHVIDISALPGYLKNHFLLQKAKKYTLLEVDVIENHVISLFINNWDKIKKAAYFIGLKLLAPQIINAPLHMKNLSSREREFICLPLPLTIPCAVENLNSFSENNISQVGANFIFGVAKELLPMIFIERLRFIFPSSFSYQNASCGNLNSALPALKWAFEYA